MIDSNLQPLCADIEGLLAAERGAPVPVGADQRVLARVEQTVAAPSVPAATGAAWVKSLLAVVAALGIGGGTYALWPSGSQPAQSHALAWPDSPRANPTPVGLAVAPTEPVAEPSPDLARAREPSPDRVSADTLSADTLSAERALLDRAQTALVAGDAPTASVAVAEHLREFPRGRLVEEREALRVQVLVRSDRSDVARRVADRFVDRYPRSIHRSAVEAAVEDVR